MDLTSFIQNAKEQMPQINNTLEFALQTGVPAGLYIECGVYSGSSITKIAKSTTQTVYGFDSFEGLPESWERPDMDFGKGVFNLNGNFPMVPSNVQLIKGWFDATLPVFVSEHKDKKIAFLHVDCDIYSSTKCIFDTLGPMLQNGTVIVFDELFNYPTYEKHEVKAFHEFLKTNRKFDVEWIGMAAPVDLNPTIDKGAHIQSAACRLIVPSRPL